MAPDGAYHVYIDVSSTGLDAMRFGERALQEEQLGLTPGHDLGRCRASAHVRLSSQHGATTSTKACAGSAFCNTPF